MRVQQARARKDHTSFSWFFDDFDLLGASSAVAQQDVAIVFLQSDSGEGYFIVDGNEGDRCEASFPRSALESSMCGISPIPQKQLDGVEWRCTSPCSRREQQQHDRGRELSRPTHSRALDRTPERDGSPLGWAWRYRDEKCTRRCVIRYC
jgi:hypothetical protein